MRTDGLQCGNPTPRSICACATARSGIRAGNREREFWDFSSSTSRGQQPISARTDDVMQIARATGCFVNKLGRGCARWRHTHRRSRSLSFSETACELPRTDGENRLLTDLVSVRGVITKAPYWRTRACIIVLQYVWRWTSTNLSRKI